MLSENPNSENQLASKTFQGRNIIMSYSANDNQNYFVQTGRTTSRVLSQPGGQQSFCLGGWTPEELQRQREVAEKRQVVADAASSKSHAVNFS